MKWYSKVAGASAALAGVGVAVGYLLPKETSVECSIRIKASPVTVFGLLNDLEKQQLWSIWKQNDPTMEVTYGDKRQGEGARYTWKGRHSGSGAITITRSEYEKRVDTFVDLGKQGTGRGYYSIKADNGSVLVTHGFSMFSGKNIFDRYYGLSMRFVLRRFFNQELATLKSVAEKMDQLQTH